MDFTLLTTDPRSKARAGELRTDHGTVPTPVFMPVGTLGAVKAVHMRELREDVKAPMMLSNTYHLYLRPGTEVLGHAGGTGSTDGSAPSSPTAAASRCIRSATSARSPRKV